ncbi:hypothetical protein JHK82_016616 [Glycine max]|nr:hypothetical protein JHK85_017043 [Glycine max]KAG5047244.1 hypothetical protein JHK86_016650 [Glycine max]KAG5149735.1 hypothetical protein JHK82_016616 [Glycine max]
MVGTDDRNKEKITTFDIMGVCERKRKKKGNYSDDVDSNSVEKVVAMWERRLSLKLLLASLNGKDSAVAMCKFCRLMGTTIGELLLNRYMVKGAEAVHAANPDVLVILSGLNFDTSLSFIQDRPVSLTFKGKLVFEVNRYGFTDAELDLDWAYWTLVDSYYFREGVIGMEEFYGLLTWDWIQITRVVKKRLQMQGIKGPPPSFLHGNLPDMQRIQSQAKVASTCNSNHSNQFLAHDYTTTLFPYFEHWRKQYGTLLLLLIY